jgi:hypothetical protein
MIAPLEPGRRASTNWRRAGDSNSIRGTIPDSRITLVCAASTLHPRSRLTLRGGLPSLYTPDMAIGLDHSTSLGLRTRHPTRSPVDESLPTPKPPLSQGRTKTVLAWTRRKSVASPKINERGCADDVRCMIAVKLIIRPQGGRICRPTPAEEDQRDHEHAHKRADPPYPPTTQQAPTIKMAAHRVVVCPCHESSLPSGGWAP